MQPTSSLASCLGDPWPAWPMDSLALCLRGPTDSLASCLGGCPKLGCGSVSLCLGGLWPAWPINSLTSCLGGRTGGKALEPGQRHDSWIKQAS